MNSSKPSIVRRTFVAYFKHKLTLCYFTLFIGYIIISIGVKMGWLAPSWHTEVGRAHEAPNWINYFGTDILGRSVLAKVLHGTEVAMSVGLTVALFSTIIGVIFGISAGYFGGIVDACIVWCYTVLAAIPTMMLLMVIPFMLGKGLKSMYIALIVAEWTEICRLVRGEVMRHKNREYIQAASAIGANTCRKLFIHILPNILPLIIVQFSLIFQNSIKYEVILSYLGVGVQHKPSWGIMISDAKTELLRGVWWEFCFTTIFMFVLLLVFNMLTDALRDALDPKLEE